MNLINTRGVTLKSRTLKHWIKKKNLTQRVVARHLGMSKRKFIRKLNLRQSFNQNEIKALILLLGARTAIRVIWFPSLQEKRKIEKYVWEGQMKKTYNHNSETSTERKKREIAEQNKESCENWEQSADFQKLIFDADKLPSQRFMRRRSNG